MNLTAHVVLFLFTADRILQSRMHPWLSLFSAQSGDLSKNRNL